MRFAHAGARGRTRAQVLLERGENWGLADVYRASIKSPLTSRQARVKLKKRYAVVESSRDKGYR